MVEAVDKDKLEIEGIVLELCRGGQFRCEIEVGDQKTNVMAYASGKMRKFTIKIVVGDKVKIELSPYDLTKGRIVFRER